MKSANTIGYDSYLFIYHYVKMVMGGRIEMVHT